MNGLEFVPYEVLNGAPCPICKITHYKFTGIARQRSNVQRHPGIEETIPARILGWALECGCLLSVADWEWTVAFGKPTHWLRRAESTTNPLPQGLMIGDHGTQHNTFS